MSSVSEPNEGSGARLKCPVCNSPLISEKQILRCANNHTFDRAKQGYVNLLLNQDKKSQNPGDTPEMVRARQRFLGLEHYAPIVQSCYEAIDKHLTTLEKQTLHYCDIACGEGYYTDKIKTHIQRSANNDGQKRQPVETIGIDISTPAVKAASRRTKNAQWLVANAFRLPVESNTQDLVTHLFSRPCPAEAARILTRYGVLVDVSAEQNHLVELRHALYGDIKTKTSGDASNEYLPEFDLVESRNIEFKFCLDYADQIKDLIAMTPHAWRATKQSIEEVSKTDNLELTGNVLVQVFKLKAGSDAQEEQ